MPRITVSVPEEMHRALRQAATRRSCTISEIVVSALAEYGLKSEEDALSIVRKARKRTRLSESEARKIAEEESRKSR